MLLDHALWAENHELAATTAIGELEQIRAKFGRCPHADQFCGVVKLGYSWMGMDVQPFQGVKGLVNSLMMLLDPALPGCVCIIQERIEDVRCELRCLCCRDMAAGPNEMQRDLVRMRLHYPRHKSDPTFATTSPTTMSFEETAKSCFNGNEKVLRQVEAEVMRLSDKWLEWFNTEGFGVPAFIRLDYVVAYRGQGSVEVWTIELCELGGSLCGYSHQPRTVAALNQCLEAVHKGEKVEGFPAPLPVIRDTTMAPSSNLETFRYPRMRRFVRILTLPWIFLSRAVFFLPRKFLVLLSLLLNYLRRGN